MFASKQGIAVTGIFMLSLFFTLCEQHSKAGHREDKLPPIVLIPSNGGSQIEARVDRATGVPGCQNKRDWFRLWLDVYQLFPDQLPCWLSYMKLDYDVTNKTNRNAVGVETRIPGFGDTKTIEHIDPTWSAWLFGNAGSMFAPFVKELVSWGYNRGSSIRGAPYDFRFAPHSLQSYFIDLKNLIEETYHQNRNKRVILVSQSLGGLVTLYFLRQQSQVWKDQYIHSFVSISAPWSGSATMVHAMTSGYTFGIPLLDNLIVRKQQRNAEAAPLQLPREPAWRETDILISTPSKNYTIANYDEWFDDIGYSVGKEKLKNVRSDGYKLEHPNVDMYCWYGSGLETADSLVYDDGFPDSLPIKVNYIDGDGIVSTPSLQSCQQFMNKPSYVNHLRQFDAEHMGILKNEDFLREFKAVVDKNRMG